MKTLLRIDSSSRIEGSHSRELADYFEKYWIKNNVDGRVIYRDLANRQIPHIHKSTIEGFYTPQDQMSPEALKVTVLSDELITELKSADEILISSPLYNLSLPSNLKAYLDQVMRIDHTFAIHENGYYGLLTNMKAYVITAKGGIYKGTDLEQYDFLEPYLKAVLNYMGIKLEELFSLEGTGIKNEVDKNKQLIEEHITNIFQIN